jgi:hypothetical protein
VAKDSQLVFLLTGHISAAYLLIIEDFARHFHRSPDQLGPDHIRQYTAHLFRDKKLFRQLGQSNGWSVAILLRQDAEAAMGRRGNALPEEENAFARVSEPG